MSELVRERGGKEGGREGEREGCHLQPRENSSRCITGKVAGRCDGGVMQGEDSKANDLSQR